MKLLSHKWHVNGPKFAFFAPVSSKIRGLFLELKIRNGTENLKIDGIKVLG